MKRVWLWWSSGKDSAWALHTLRASADVEVEALVTSINAEADRVAMHAVRRDLLARQAEALGLPLRVIELPYPCPNGAYEAAAADVIDEAESAGVTHMAFGDLFLEDVRAYREELLARSPIEPLFPLWERDTRALSAEIIAAGVEAYLTCVDPKRLSAEFAGRRYDADLLAQLPPSVDPCGENGEFHSFVANAPGFAWPIPVDVGERVERDGFVFADVVPRREPTEGPRAVAS